MHNYLHLFTFIVLSGVLGSMPATAEIFESGYAGNWSNMPGEPAEFYLNATDTFENTEVFIYDLLNRSYGSVNIAMKPQTIAASNLEPWMNGNGFEPTTIDLPDIPSGFYYLDGPGGYSGRRVPFIVNDPAKAADVVVVYPTNTINAYSMSPSNGNPEFSHVDQVNLYQVDVDGNLPEAVSFHRKQHAQIHLTAGLDRLLLDSDLDYKYISDADLDNPDALKGAKIAIIPGHSEYWTVTARENFDSFVEGGGSGLVLSGNTMYRSVGYDDPEAPTQMTFSPRRQFKEGFYPTWKSIGVDFRHGGNGSVFRGNDAVNTPYDGWKIVDASPSYLANNGVAVGDIIANPTIEYDGVPYTSLDPITGPVIDTDKLDFHRIELIAFDNAAYGNSRQTAGAWIDFQKTQDSGRIITVGSLNWTSNVTGNVALKQSITSDMIDALLIARADFDNDDVLTGNDVELLLEALDTAPASLRFDINGDQQVNMLDLDHWVHEFAKTDFGDADLDGRVTFFDFHRLSANFGKATNWEGGDFTGDGFARFDDFLMLANNFNRAADATAANTVPESTISIEFLVVLLGCLARCNRQRNRHCV